MSVVASSPAGVRTAAPTSTAMKARGARIAVTLVSSDNAALYQLEKRLMANGTVKFFNTQKGFGFVTPDDGGKDAFIHVTALERAGINSLNEGDKISYDLETGRDGKLSATNVKLLS